MTPEKKEIIRRWRLPIIIGFMLGAVVVGVFTGFVSRYQTLEKKVGEIEKKQGETDALLGEVVKFLEKATQPKPEQQPNKEIKP